MYKPNKSGVWNPLPDTPKKKTKKQKKAAREAREKQKEERWLRFNGDYKAYLQSEWWKKRRKKALHRANYQCEECYTEEKLHVHHLSYKNIGNERPEDLQVLCAACHYHKHEAIIEMNKHFNSI